MEDGQSGTYSHSLNLKTLGGLFLSLLVGLVLAVVVGMVEWGLGKKRGRQPGDGTTSNAF